MSGRNIKIAAVGIAVFIGGCGFQVFEDVQTDPHPPTISDVKASPETLRSGDTFSVSVKYADEGGDIVSFHIEDLESYGAWTLIPASPQNVPVGGAGDAEPAPEFFPGVTGTAVSDPENLPTLIASQLGPHRIQIWAVDSHESRSEKLEFVITLQ